jgi:hypothetical protein
MCADAAYPLAVRGYVKVAPGQTIAVDTHLKALRVEAGLVSLEGSGPARTRRPVRVKELDAARPFNRKKTHWHLTLPYNLRHATILELDVLYPNGDANFWAGIRSDLRTVVGSQ